MDAHRYWRLRVTANWGQAALTTIGGIELRPTVGGANQAYAGNGTASSTSIYSGHVAANAFDGNTATVWATDYWVGSSVSGAWLQWDFGAANEREVAQIAINLSPGSAGFSVNSFLRSCVIECSDNGSTWSTRQTITDITQLAGTYLYSVPIYVPSEALVTLPRLLLGIVTGSVVRSTLPVISVSAFSGGEGGVHLPSLSTYATAHDSTGDRAADITLPSLTVAIRTGANAAASLPKLSSVATGTVTNLADANLSLPSLTAAASATVAGMASAAISLPSMGGSSYAGALCSVTIGSFTTQATGTTGSLGRAQVTLPLFEATAIATAQNRGSAAIVLPSMQMGATVRAALILPSLQLTAIGTAVVTATYEAYAVNLKHSDPNANDEATRYTNYPFTHVVRYQGSYYGANSTGLYLLEGTTDAGTAIPWEVKTAITDFKSPMKKVPEAAYFSGRFGPNSTIRLHVGEKTPITYAFSTPRGQLAQNHRQKFGKGKECQSRYYALSASGTGEADIDGIEPVFHNTTRRI